MSPDALTPPPTGLESARLAGFPGEGSPPSFAGPFACAGVFAVLGGFALAPTYTLSALCGWSFGFAVGLTATLGGFLGAALLARALAAAADGGRVMRVVAQSPKWQAVRCALLEGSLARTTLIVALVRLAPFAAFSLTNLAMASMKVRPAAYALGTVLGMTPRTAFIVFTASQMQTLDVTPADQPWVTAAAVVTTLAVCFILGLIGKRALASATGAADTARTDGTSACAVAGQA